MSKPPDYVIEAARVAAIKSPCAKSKRGAVVFDPQIVAAFPGTPHLGMHGRGFNGQPAPFMCSGNCGEACRQLCLHAEQRAIADSLQIRPTYDLLHVKVVDGAVVPSGGPSCWQCPRLVVEVGLRGVWLYEMDTSTSYLFGEPPPDVWRFYTAVEFHRETLRACGIEVSC